jgi:short-subunit dehydrogenase
MLRKKNKEIRKNFDIKVIENLWMMEDFMKEMIKKKKGNVVGIYYMDGVMGMKNIVKYCG